MPVYFYFQFITGRSFLYLKYTRFLCRPQKLSEAGNLKQNEEKRIRTAVLLLLLKKTVLLIINGYLLTRPFLLLHLRVHQIIFHIEILLDVAVLHKISMLRRQL